MQDLVSRMESSLEAVALRETPVKKYSSRHHLRKDMVGDHPIFSLFVSGASDGSATRFHCMICKRDVSMQSRGSREFIRHYSGDRHWIRDVTYRVQQGLPVFDQLMKPLELTSNERDEYLGRDVVEKGEGFSFPEDLLPSCTRVDSTIPLLTMVNCVAELCRWGGSYILLRKLWGNFRATLGPDNPLYNLHWNRPETLVSNPHRDELCCFSSLCVCCSCVWTSCGRRSRICASVEWVGAFVF